MPDPHGPSREPAVAIQCHSPFKRQERQGLSFGRVDGPNGGPGDGHTFPHYARLAERDQWQAERKEKDHQDRQAGTTG